MGSDSPGWADNVERMFIGTLRFLDRVIVKNRPLLWVLALAVAIRYGWANKDDIAMVVEAVAKLLPGVGG